MFETARLLFGPEILAYYYDLPFEETLRRHAGRAQAASFGEAAMRDWWLERDYMGVIPEKTITADMTLADTIRMIQQDIEEL